MAHPRSKKPRISQREPGVFDVYIAEPAAEGKANEAIVKILAKHFRTPKTSIRITRGLKSKQKIVRLG